MFNKHFIIIFYSLANFLTGAGYSNPLFSDLCRAITSETFLSFVYNELTSS